MNYSNIKTIDISNGVGVRTSLFVSGCRIHCDDCFNNDIWDFNSGKPFTQETIDYILDTLRNPNVDGLTILGGEPLEPENQSSVLKLVRAVRDKYSNKTIWMYTGFTWEDLHNNIACRGNTALTRLILSEVDVLVDGPFVKDVADSLLRFKGSANQRLIDCKKSSNNEVVLWRDYPICETHAWVDHEDDILGDEQ